MNIDLYYPEEKVLFKLFARDEKDIERKKQLLDSVKGVVTVFYTAIDINCRNVTDAFYVHMIKLKEAKKLKAVQERPSVPERLNFIDGKLPEKPVKKYVKPEPIVKVEEVVPNEPKVKVEEVVPNEPKVKVEEVKVEEVKVEKVEKPTVKLVPTRQTSDDDDDDDDLTDEELMEGFLALKQIKKYGICFDKKLLKDKEVLTEKFEEYIKEIKENPEEQNGYDRNNLMAFLSDGTETYDDVVEPKEEDVITDNDCVEFLYKRQMFGEDIDVYGDTSNHLFLAKDVAKLIDYAKTGKGAYNVSKMLEKVGDNEKVKKHCSLIKKDSVAQSDNPKNVTIIGNATNRMFLTENGLKQLLANSRNKKAREMLKSVDDWHMYKNTPKEIDFQMMMDRAIKTHITQVKEFKKDLNEDVFKYEEQKGFLKYRADFYFDCANLIVEYDENKHKYHVEEDNKRMKEIKDHINKTKGKEPFVIRVEEGMELEGIVKIITFLGMQ
jgi:very-short-patch-repair endonuclease